MRKRDWRKTTAKVFTCGWANTPVSGASAFSGDFLVTFSYEVDGQIYSGEFKSSREWREGETFDLRYDANDPSVNDERESKWINIVVYSLAVLAVVVWIWFDQTKTHR